LKLLPRQGGQAVGAAPEVHRLRRDQNPHARRNRNRVAALTARSTAVSVAASVPGATRTIAAPITISITPLPLIGSDPIGASDL
jgi:FixJ family two-component response regulator